MSSKFFKHIDISQYEITNSDLLRACKDELIMLGLDTILTEDELMVQAEYKLKKFKDFMRPLFQ